MLVDLDPGEGVKWGFVVEAAVPLRNLLAAEGWPKTTGGKGLHVMRRYRAAGGSLSGRAQPPMMLRNERPLRPSSLMRLIADLLVGDLDKSAILTDAPTERDYTPRLFEEIIRRRPSAGACFWPPTAYLG